MSFTENDYEQAVLEFFRENLGYTEIYGPDIARDYREPLYEVELIPVLEKINPHIPSGALVEVVNKLRDIEGSTLILRNEIFMNYLQNGMTITYVDKITKEEGSGHVRFVDYDNPNNNSFIIANQWTVVENDTKRPDLIVKSEKFSDMLNRAMNAYLDRNISNEDGTRIEKCEW